MQKHAAYRAKPGISYAGIKSGIHGYAAVLLAEMVSTIKGLRETFVADFGPGRSSAEPNCKLEEEGVLRSDITDCRSLYDDGFLQHVRSSLLCGVTICLFISFLL